MISVIIADDHHLVRHGIRSLLVQADDISVVGEASDGYEAIKLVKELDPDVLLLDIGMPRLGGIQTVEQLKLEKLQTRMVMLSMHTDRQLVRQSLRAGANGYILKSSLFEELLLAVRAAAQGKTYLSPEVSQVAIDALRADYESSDASTAYNELTSREREVLKLLAEGLTNKDIAELLSLSIRTVQKHRANLMSKLDVHDVAGLTRVALKHGLIFIEE